MQSVLLKKGVRHKIPFLGQFINKYVQFRYVNRYGESLNLSLWNAVSDEHMVCLT